MLNEKLLDGILDRFGRSARPSADLDGLQTIYGAWCLSVPFDNIAKLVSLRSGVVAPLPGLDPVEFFTRWQDHGAAGTCWPTSNALFELVQTLGFDARRVAGSMRDTGIVTHGSVKVRIDEKDWLVDSSMLTGSVLPLTDEIFISGDTLFGAEVEPVDGTHVVWAELTPNSPSVPCRMLVDPATEEFYSERYEASRLRSPFNERLYARRNKPSGERIVLNANVRISKSSERVEIRELTPSELCEALREEIGISGALIDAWRHSGALDASFRPASDPAPAPITAEPPSKRARTRPD